MHLDLKWETYSDHLKDMLHEMYKSSNMADVTLVTDDDELFKAHKIILSACSPVFKKILSNSNEQCSVIYLRGIQSQVLTAILKFIYHGEIVLNQCEITEFFAVGRDLKLKEIDIDTKNQDVDHRDEVLNETLEQGKVYNLTENKETNKFESNEKIIDYFNIKQEQKTIENESLQLASDVNNDNKIFITAPKYKIPCTKCDKGYYQKSYLEAHMRTVHEGLKYVCDQCEKQYTDIFRLRIHVKTRHEGELYNCNQCDYKAYTQKKLKSHIEYKHEGKMYNCDECEYKSIEKRNLIIHKDSKHLGITHNCDQCDKKFSKKTNLTAHVKSVHEGIKRLPRIRKDDSQ